MKNFNTFVLGGGEEDSINYQWINIHTNYYNVLVLISYYLYAM